MKQWPGSGRPSGWPSAGQKQTGACSLGTCSSVPAVQGYLSGSVYKLVRQPAIEHTVPIERLLHNHVQDHGSSAE